MADLRVNIVLPDPHEAAIMEQRLATYAERSEDFTPVCTPTPLGERECDCYAVSSDSVLLVTDPTTRPPTWLPVIAFGPPEKLRQSFLDGCTDYMKEPWSPDELYFRAIKNRRGRTHRFAWGDMEIDGLHIHLYLNGRNRANAAKDRTILINRRQAALMDALLALRGTVVERNLLFYAMWERDGEGSRAVDMQLHSLRDSLTAADPTVGGENLIRSVYGAGYIIE